MTNADEQGPSVASVVLNWNNYEDTSTCLDSLLKQDYLNHRIVVVDNGSSDGSADRIEAEYPSISLLRTGENLGFAGGMNKGIKLEYERGADFVWILNNDTLFPDEDTLSTLVRTMENHPDIGVVSPIVHYYPETDNVWFKRGVVDIARAKATHDSNVPPSAYIDDELIEDDYIPLCCALVRSDVLREIGDLSDIYFLYYEDVELGVEMRRAGYDLATHLGTRVWHYKTASTDGHLGATISYYKSRNRLLFARRYRDEITPAFLLSYLQWFILQFGNRVVHHEIAGVRGFVEGLRDGLWRRTGKGPYP